MEGLQASSGSIPFLSLQFFAPHIRALVRTPYAPHSFATDSLCGSTTAAAVQQPLRSPLPILLSPTIGSAPGEVSLCSLIQLSLAFPSLGSHAVLHPVQLSCSPCHFAPPPQELHPCLSCLFSTPYTSRIRLIPKALQAKFPQAHYCPYLAAGDTLNSV